jgi:hypothetical protein
MILLEDSHLHTHRRENLKSYMILLPDLKTYFCILQEEAGIYLSPLKEDHRLRVLENKMLRKILGNKMEEVRGTEKTVY